METADWNEGVEACEDAEGLHDLGLRMAAEIERLTRAIGWWFQQCELHCALRHIECKTEFGHVHEPHDGSDESIAAALLRLWEQHGRVTCAPRPIRQRLSEMLFGFVLDETKRADQVEQIMALFGVIEPIPEPSRGVVKYEVRFMYANGKPAPSEPTEPDWSKR